MKLQQKNYWQRVALYLFVFVVSIVILYPYFVMFTTAAKTNAEMYAADASILPKEWQLSNFIDIWTAAPHPENSPVDCTSGAWSERDSFQFWPDFLIANRIICQLYYDILLFGVSHGRDQDQIFRGRH